MNAADIQRYWDERAQLHPEVATTDDLPLRDLEFKILAKHLEFLHPKIVLDAGCGDGLTTIRLAKQFPDTRFLGIDYAQGMINLASINLSLNPIPNVSFSVQDLFSLKERIADVAITCRTLINVPSWDAQCLALEALRRAAPSLLLIENFREPHNRLNALRIRCGLEPIPVRHHNCYFSESLFHSKYPDVKIISFASTYYALTRVFYARMAKDARETPRYDHPCAETASKMPDFLSDLDVAPMKLIILA